MLPFSTTNDLKHLLCVEMVEVDNNSSKVKVNKCNVYYLIQWLYKKKYILEWLRAIGREGAECILVSISRQ